ncbi:MAG: efflux RND transporter periplasmic adaptor subunit [Candidatus Hydrogenedentota bacterium]
MKKAEGRVFYRAAQLRWPAALAGILVAGLMGGYFFASWNTPVPAPTAEPGHEETKAAESSTTWTCSMHPQIRQSEPGQCPICAMDLIPASEAGEEAGTGPREFQTTADAVALMQVETAPVVRRFVEAEVHMVGKVDYDETRLAYITAWIPGRIERMYADFTGTLVRKGDHMVDIYSPELLSAKEELRRAKKARDQISASAPPALQETARSTLDAVRNKLRRWGMTDAQITRAEEGNATTDSITIYAPGGGTVIERNGQEGMYVDTGERIYTIADLDKVWVQLEAYESDLPWIHFGQMTTFTTEAYPGETFEGAIAFIDPTLNPRTRTVDVRVNVPNEKRRLKPGMFVRAVVQSKLAKGGRVMDPALAGKWISPMHPEIVKDGPGTCDICGMDLVPAEELGYVSADPGAEDIPLIIPATAPLITGRRAVVYVEVPNKERPTFEGREVVLGQRAGEHYIVRSGLEEGERVVTEGNFKIDSALEIQAKPSMMSMPGGAIIGGEADAAMPSALGGVFEAYMPVQEALAHDNIDKAQVALPLLEEAVEAVPEKKMRESLAAAVADLASAKDLKTMRDAFKPLSNTLIEAIRRVELADAGPIYQIHCPMAFDFDGADWLQRDQEIRNPYFGDEMFSCGTVERQLAAGEAASHAAQHTPEGGAAHAHEELGHE